MWRNTGRPVRLAFVGDAKILFPFLYYAYTLTWFAFYAAIASIVLLVFLNYQGFTLPVLFRYLKLKVTGGVKLHRSNIEKRKIYGK